MKSKRESSMKNVVKLNCYMENLKPIILVLPVVVTIHNIPDTSFFQHQRMQNHSCRGKMSKHFYRVAKMLWGKKQQE